MRFKKTYIFIILFSLTFFIISEIIAFYANYQSSKHSIYKNDKIAIDNLINAQEENLRMLANFMSNDGAVIKAYKQNNPEIIIKHIGPIWEKMKKEKLIHEIHFFKPPAISFVNFSNFHSIGKDVSKVRKDILWVTSSFKPSTHNLMCKTYAGVRATYPILDKNGKLLGGVSLGKKIDWLPSAIKKNTKRDAFLVFTEKSATSLAPRYYKDFMKDKILVGDYILANSTIKGITPKIIKNIDFSKHIQYLTLDGNQYLLDEYPILDFSKNTMGYIFVLNNTRPFYIRYLKDLSVNFILIFITAIIIFFITKRVLEDMNKKKEEQLSKQLYTDELTKLPNRIALIRDMELYPNATLAIINIKSFKNINDVFGFDIGNHTLQALAQKLLESCSEKELLLYRIGNDEFAFLNNNLKSEVFLNFIAHVITHIENETFFYSPKEIEINISIYAGICLGRKNRLVCADVALAEANKLHKDYTVYSSSENLIDEQGRKLSIINIIKNALLDDDILLYVQPIVDKNGKIHKYETLVRLRHDNKILTPYHFLDISKKTKYYPFITRRVIKKAFKMFKDRKESFSINLVAEDILNESTLSFIRKEILAFKEKERIVFEIVESEDIYKIKEVAKFIKEMQSLNIKIAIDDFGTGYSNFSYMLELQPDYIKIDGSLIKDINTNKNAKNIVTTIIAFARELNCEIVAEFIHSEEIFEICKNLGIDEFQGYYFSEPKPL